MRGFIRAFSRIEKNDATVRRLEAEIASLRAIIEKPKPSENTVELDRGINKVSIFIALGAGLVLAEGFGAVNQLGLRILNDFLSYLFGIIAAVVGSLAVYRPARAIVYFWMSYFFIAFGFFFYLVSKEVKPFMPAAVIAGLIISLSVLVIYHEIVTRSIDEGRLWKFVRIFTVLISGGAVLVMLAFLLLGLEKKSTEKCQISLTSATMVRINTMTPEATANGNAGFSDKGVSTTNLPSDLSVIISPCSKRILGDSIR